MNFEKCAGNCGKFAWRNEKYCLTCLRKIQEEQNPVIEEVSTCEIASSRRLIVKRNDIVTGRLKKGQYIKNIIFQADKNADFLNQAFGWNGKQCYKTIWKYSETCDVWMVRFYENDNKEWRNWFVDEKEDVLKEYYMGTSSVWNGKPIQQPSQIKHRIVVAIEDRGVHRYYQIKGVYVCDVKKSTAEKRIYNRVSDYLP